MWRYILTTVVSGTLMVGGSIALAGEPTPSGQDSAKPEMLVQQGSPILSFEKRLNLKPLTDKELDQITAAGAGPIVYMLPPWVYSSSLLRAHFDIRQSPVLINGAFVQSNQIFQFF